MEEELLQVKQLVGHKLKVKRGWFDIVEKGMKVLFGTLTSEDAEYYQQKIDTFDQHEQDAIEILRSQTKVVHSTLGNFNSTIGTLNYNEKILASNNKKLENHLNEFYEQVNYLEIRSDFKEHSAIFHFIVNQFQLEIIILTNSILQAKQGHLHPSIIDPQKLITELSAINNKLPRGLDFPVPLDIWNLFISFITF